MGKPGARGNRRGQVRPLAVVVLLGLAAQAGWGEAPAGAGEVWTGLAKLRVLGSVLYVAAHPDDENTAMLAYLASGRQLRTAYLSLTRGDGGQNLIGPEQAPLLGVIRSAELLAARRIDGAEQYFTRAVDFGYSKSAQETLAVWGREEVLGDVVRVIRTFKPDVVITRFPSTADAGHGHHTASALLAAEAFAAAGDSGRFPDQVAELGVWRPRRLLWNAWRPQPEGRSPAAPNVLKMDLGLFDFLRGLSYAELAAQARSMHKSQGFGAAPRRGSQVNYLEHVAGEPAQQDLMEGIDTSWGRLPGGKVVDAALQAAQQAFDVRQPAAVVPALLAARRAMLALPSNHWVEVKRRELERVLRAATGVWLEAVGEEPSVPPGGTLRVNATAINRAGARVGLRWVAVEGGEKVPRETALPTNQPVAVALAMAVPPDAAVSAPGWLREPPEVGLFRADPRVAMAAFPPPPFRVRFALDVEGEAVEMAVPVVHRTVDPVRGERERWVQVLPPVTAAGESGVVIFPGPAPRPVRLRLAAHGPGRGSVRLRVPTGWQVEPAEVPFVVAKRGEVRVVEVQVVPPAVPAQAVAAVEVEVDGRRSSWRTAEVDYDHLPPLTVPLPAQLTLVQVDVRIAGGRVGYVTGPGDEVPGVLRQLGYQVTLLADEELEGGALEQFDAIVVGARAYNTRDRLQVAQPRLLAYVAQGGRLVVQYNTHRELVTDALGPYPLTLGRERVTVEDTPVSILVPDHPLLSFPNRITRADFDGWVQERGLYFPASWDPRYDAPLAMQDPGEAALLGGLLVASYGKGTFVYTSLAFFRQLPAGVPGALRLFANLLAGGKR